MPSVKYKNENGTWLPIAGKSGVEAFNGRAGAVKPAFGDYTAEMVGAAEKTHASQHAAGGSDPITPAAIGALTINKKHYKGNIDEFMEGACLAVNSSGDLPWTDRWFDLIAIPSGTGAVSQIAMCDSTPGTPTRFCFRHHNGSHWSLWSTAATTDYALNKAGGTMTGTLQVANSGQSNCARISDGTDGACFMSVVDKNNPTSCDRDFIKLSPSLSFASALSLFRYTYPDGVFKAQHSIVLHTGNKPSGSYTGTGTAKTIDTGGIGNAIAIWGDGWTCYVSHWGGMAVGDATVKGLSASAGAYFRNGVLTLPGAEAAVNKAQVTYYYQVL